MNSCTFIIIDVLRVCITVEGVVCSGLSLILTVSAIKSVYLHDKNCTGVNYKPENENILI